MWGLVFLNGVGLLSRAVPNPIVMYIFFAISFVAFSHKYAVISWDVIYENWVDSDGIVDAKVANEFVCFFVLVCFFLLMIQKIELWSIVVAIVQCIIFHVFKIIRDKSVKNINIMICYIAELLLGVIICLA